MRKEILIFHKGIIEEAQTGDILNLNIIIANDKYLVMLKSRLFLITIVFGFNILLITFSCVRSSEKTEKENPMIIYAGDSDINEVIKKAVPFSTIICNSNHVITVREKIVIDKPMTLRGLHAKLPVDLKMTDILSVQSEHVVIEDFRLLGNDKIIDEELNFLTVPLTAKGSLISIEAGHFRIENGFVYNASGHGIVVSARKKGGDLCYGIIRNIIGRNIARDVVSLEGEGERNHYARNIVVENISGYSSGARGVVEVSDGTRNIVIRDIYAESCLYGIDLQDHHKQGPGQSNRDILIQGVFVNNCSYAIRGNRSSAQGHRNLTIRDVTKGSLGTCAINITNTKGVTLDNIRIPREDISFHNCSGVVFESRPWPAD